MADRLMPPCPETGASARLSADGWLRGAFACRFRFLAGVIAGLLLGWLSGPVWAAPAMPDPTRPPPGVALDTEDADAAPGEPLLESVLLPKKGRPLAVIGGKTVLLGESYGEARLVRVTEREAVLSGPAGVERLFLTPGIAKTAVRGRRTKAPGAARMETKP